MNFAADVQCPTCHTFFRPQAQKTPAAVFCPRCGKNIATAAPDEPAERSNNAVLAVLLGGCLVGMLALCVVVMGIGYFFLSVAPAKVNGPVAEALPQTKAPSRAIPETTTPVEGVPVPGIPAAQNSLPPGGGAASSTAPEPPAVIPPAVIPPAGAREPNPFDKPAPPGPTVPSVVPPQNPVSPVPATVPAPTPTKPAPRESNPRPPSAGVDTASLKKPWRYGWKPGDSFNYSVVVTAKNDEGQRDTRGTSAYSVRQADPRTALDGTPLERADKADATGSAFFVTPQGHLVTCAHVVRGATKVRVRWGDVPREATVIAVQHEHDLALLKIEATDVPALELGDSDSVELAQEVRAVGYPLSDVLGASVKVSRGTIAGLIDRDERRLLQVDAPINAGNSGGPLVDERARVVGVATSKLAGEDVSNVGFAVPAKVLQQWLTELKIPHVAPQDRERLEGPELARLVTPAVVMLDVELGPGGIGQERQFILGFSASLNTQNQPAAPPGAFPFAPPPFGGFNMAIDHGQLRVDAAGSVREFEGKEHLPYLVGPLGLLPFEPLPPEGTQKWRVRRPLTLALMKSDDEALPGLPRMARPRMPFGPRGPVGPGGPFGPGAPFGPGGPIGPGFPFGPRGRAEEEKPLAVIPALETIDYEVVELTDRACTVRKRSELKTVGKNDGLVAVELNLTGDYTVERELGLLVRLNMEGKFTETKGEVTRTIPVKLSCERLTPPPPGNAPVPVAGQPPAAPLPQPPAKPVLADDEITKALIDAINPAAEFAARHQALLKLAGAAPADARRAEVVTGVLPVVDDKNFALSASAIRTIGAWAGKEQIPTLIKLLDDTQGLTRLNVFLAIGECRVADERLAKELVERLFVREDRSMAYQALRTQENAAEDALIEALQQPDRDSQVDFFVFILLRENGGQKSIDALKKILESQPDARLTTQINSCLKAIETRLQR